MIRRAFGRAAIVLAAWLPFYAIWVLFALSFGQEQLTAVLAGSLVSMGSAGLLGIPVWFAARRWPWPVGFSLKFYLLQLCLAFLYAAAWTAAVQGFEFARRGTVAPGFGSWIAFARQMLLGIWLYAVFAGISHAVQTRIRLHEKETLAAKAEALAAAARLDALRARLNPHFLFNALHTLAALVKFRPAMAEGAIERLGDMLRYTLQEDGRELVEFSEEYDFTRQYLAFEQLRYEDRLKVDLKVDPECFNFDLPPFSIQTLAENAVHHAIDVRPEGGSIRLECSCRNGRLHVSVHDDGPGQAPDAGESHRFGLRALRERLAAAFGPLAELRVGSRADGFEAVLVVPAAAERASVGDLRKARP